MSLWSEIARHSRVEHAAIIEPIEGLRITYPELLGHVERLAASFRAAGFSDQGHVGFIIPNGPEAIAMFLAAWAAGAATFPINPSLTVEEIERACEATGVSALIIDPLETRADLAAMCVRRGLSCHKLRRFPALDIPSLPRAPASVGAQDENGVALLLQTSGTTGTPKTVPLRQRNLVASSRNIAAFYRLSTADRTYLVMPLFHIHGIVASALATLVSGGTVVVPRRVTPRRFGPDLASHEITWVSAVPTVLARFVDALPETRLSALRFGRTSSAALPSDMRRRFEDNAGVPLLEAYGMTEASHQMASNPLPPAERRDGSVGIPTGTEISIFDAAWQPVSHGSTGEIVVRGPGVVDGYLDSPAANEAGFRDGWFRTGDLGTLSTDGYLTLVGRIKEMINRGGEKIAPREIDDVLLRHPAVAEAVAYATADVKYGEVVHAAVVCSTEVPVRELLAHCRDHLAAFKVPARITVLDAIPKGPTGKVQRSQLSRLLVQ